MTDAERDRQRVLPYRDAIRAACAAYDQNPFILAGVGLRESGFGWAPGYEPKGDPCGWGDKGNGFGLFQIDKRYHATFVESEWSKEPVNQAGYACAVLRDARAYLLKKKLGLAGRDLDEAMLCAYNAGAARVYRALRRQRDPNGVTTGGDYGRWVLVRSESLRLLDPMLFVS